MQIEREVLKRREAKDASKKFKTLGFVPSDKTGCGYYRMALPSIALCRRGIPAHLLTSDRIHLYSIADSIILQRPHQIHTISFIEEAQSNGIQVFFELDDNIFDVPKYNQAYTYWTDYRKQSTIEIIKACDAVIASTPYLGDVLKQFNPDVRIVPNAIDDDVPFSMLPSYLSLSEEIIIGWVGSSFHKNDIVIFDKLIPAIMEKYDNVKFLTMGEPPPKKLNVFGNRMISIPFVDSVFYHRVLSKFSMQIGIAPLVDNEFNRCKSAVKVLEYLYTKTFPIVSDIEPYSHMLKDKDFGMLIPTSEDSPGTLDDWMDRIDFCIQHLDKTEDLANKGHDFILENFSIDSDNMFSYYKAGYDL